METCGLCHTEYPHRARGLAGQAQPAFHSRTRRCGHRRDVGSGCRQSDRGRQGSHPLARIRLRRLRVLRIRTRDPVPQPAGLWILGRRSLCRVRIGPSGLCGTSPRRPRSVGRSAAHVCWRHDLQGGEGGGYPVLGPGRHLRHRGLGSSGGQICPYRRSLCGCCRPDRQQAHLGA